MEQTSPAHFARVDQSTEIRFKPLRHVPWLPHFLRRGDRHINDLRRADNIRSRHEAPITAVVGILAIVTHHEIVVRRHRKRRPIFHRVRWLVAVWLVERLPAYVDHALLDFDRVARQADRALDEIRIPRQRSAEHDNLLPLRIPPQGHVKVRKRNAHVVAEAAHNQVIAYQYGLLHRAAGNHPRLHESAFDYQEGENHPEPRKHLAPHTVTHRIRAFRLNFFYDDRFSHLSCHDEPPLRVAPAPLGSCRCSTTCKIFVPYLPQIRATIRARDTRANRRPKTSVLPRSIGSLRSILRAAAYPRRNNRAKSSADS